MHVAKLRWLLLLNVLLLLLLMMMVMMMMMLLLLLLLLLKLLQGLCPSSGRACPSLHRTTPRSIQQQVCK